MTGPPSTGPPIAVDHSTPPYGEKALTVAPLITALPSGPPELERFATTYSVPVGPTVTVGCAVPATAARVPTGADHRSFPVAALTAIRFEGGAPPKKLKTVCSEYTVLPERLSAGAVIVGGSEPPPPEAL